MKIIIETDRYALPLTKRKNAGSMSDAAKLIEVPNLAPGDFRTVRQSMYYLGGEVTNAQRIAELAKESSVKRDTKKAGRIGF